ncbi:uncharacterized protein [Parasteatoda tepidariorum]|uniref:uncharacterized protein n=1 Tax=Parasteatoda tepidariorum TaxID=114398 RepID=UPI00077FD074
MFKLETQVLNITNGTEILCHAQPLLKPKNPLEITNIEINLDLVKTVHGKKIFAPIILKNLALETMAVRYPVDDWLHVFIDGSQFDCHFNVGAGVFSELFSFYVPAGYIGTTFDGEVVALSTVLQQLLALQHKFENAVLFSDSQAAIQSISAHERPLTPEISRCQDLSRSLFLKGKRIVLQ